MNKNELYPTPAAIAAFVLEEFIKTGVTGYTVKEIAAGTKLSEGAVRRAINKGYGAVPGTVCTEKTVVVVERNYHSVVCERRVDAWAASREALRAEILRLKEAKA